MIPVMREIVQNGDPVLRKKAEKIAVSDITASKMQRLISDMKTLLAKEKYGVALAAPQVGEPFALFIVSGKALARGRRNAKDENAEEDEDEREEETTKKEPPPPDLVFINPEFLKMSRKKTEKHEGCLSVRGKWGTVPRADKATVCAYDEHGKPFTRGASGFLAHIYQHEMDHLNGVLYIDKATELYDEKEQPEEK